MRILDHAAAATPLLLDELRRAIAARPNALIGFATGGTFAPLLTALDAELRAGRMGGRFLATHLDEYLGFGPERAGGMVHELGERCPALLALLPRGAFFPVPHDGGDAGLAAHGERLRRAGGVQLQLLGIGRNGHLAFNEPGTPLDRGFHVATLAEVTRADARARFAPAEPPTQAATAGLATILAAERLVVCAFSDAKTAAVRAMLTGPIDPSCPASVVRRHRDALVLLDPAAARDLAGTDVVCVRGAALGDDDGIAAVVRSAFPTAAEAQLVASLREHGRAAVELVAVAGGDVVGHVACSVVTVDGQPGAAGLGIAPLAVHPDWQRRGAGTALMRAALTACRAHGAGFVVLLGAPEYYGRFGFTRADAVGLRNEYGAGPEFQVLELVPGGVPAGGGLVRYGPDFDRFAPDA